MRQPKHIRIASWVILLSYLNASCPLAVVAAAMESTKLAPTDPLVRTPATVRVNRASIKNAVPATRIVFSPEPTVAEIFSARVLAEPFVPAGGLPNAKENAALAQSISAYVSGGARDFQPFEDFLLGNPDSKWSLSVRLNLGLHWYTTADFTPAMAAFERVWVEGKGFTDSAGRLLTDRGIAELLRMHARLGRMDTLDKLLQQIAAREFTGQSTELIAGVYDGLALMKSRPDAAFRCGPAALDRILAAKQRNLGFAEALMGAKSTELGMNLGKVHELANQVGLALQMAHREPGAEILSPAVIHWKLGHYAALFRDGDGFRVEDPTFGHDSLHALAPTIDREASGYFLVPAGKLPKGWRAVTAPEGEQVWGKGSTYTQNADRTRIQDKKVPDECGNGGMAVARALLMTTSLSLSDRPVGYAPPLGPAVYFTATYNQREASQPTMMDYSNIGSKWIHNWLTFVDEGSIPGSGTAVLSASLRVAGGGTERFTTSSMTVSPLSYPYSYQPQALSRTLLTKIDATTFVLTEPDGSESTFGRQTGAVGSYRYFLTKKADRTGQAITLAYDAQNRLTSIADALGQVTTLSYDLAADPLKITKVTDPFGRFASFSYDALTRLERITDVIGLTSQFTHQGSGDFVQALTTPYGTSTFAFGQSTSGTRVWWLEMTDPLGDKQRVESRDDWSGLPGSGATPAGMSSASSFQNYRNTLYWDKKAMKLAPNDVNAARIYHWLHTALNETSGTLENEKQPFEARVFYEYEGQTSTIFEGATASPVRIGRVLDDGTTQLSQFEYNVFGRVTKATDPFDRATTFIYDSAGQDLMETRQKTGPNVDDYEVLSKASYNSKHEPLTLTDAAGQVTTLTYNPAFQPSTITDAKAQVTRFFYDPAGSPAGSRLGDGSRDPAATGYLVAIDGPLVGAADTTTISYDGYGRPRTITDTEGYAVVTDYDAFDRPTIITYPDNTFRQLVYDRLDQVRSRDRRGRITQYRHNALQQLAAETDPLGRVTGYEWCRCGALQKLVDPKGNVTNWVYDVQGRMTEKRYSDGSSVHYTYENTTSRLHSVTDAKNQVTNYVYYKDDALQQVSYSNAALTTPSVNYDYEVYYPRVALRTDGIGVTSYAYNTIPTTPTPGAGRLSSIDGPWANDTISYTYDELGRALTTSVNGTSNEYSITYDALGRIDTTTNALGAFQYSYIAASNRLDNVVYPSGQRTNYAYFGNTGDLRLQQITNLKAGGAALSTFAYTYDVQGIIQTWSKQMDAGTAQTSSFKYDAADQLTEALVPFPASGNKTYYYRYDKGGKRTSEQVDNGVAATSVNTLNQITAMSGTGPIRFEGSINEPGTVAINGVNATVAADNSFKADVPLISGSNTVTIVAKDSSNNSTSKTYTVPVGAGSNRALTYDPNGNLVNDGAGKIYDWDAADRLVKITQGADVIEFAYDGGGRRVQEKLNSVEVKRWIWNGGPQPCEERDSSNSVTKRFFGGLGEQIGGVSYFFANDHLGSVREMTNSAGAIQARYEYDAYGRETKITGPLEADFGFTGFYRHQASGTNLTIYRAYDSGLGRWLNRDPIAEEGGINLYAYVGNNPANAVDPLGLDTNGIRLNLTAAFGLGGTLALGVHKDSSGAWDVQFSGQKTTALPGASATLGYTHTNADSVDDLTAWGGAVGVSGGYVVGGEANFVFSKSYVGYDLGVGVSTPGATPQVSVGYTWSLRKMFRDVKDWLSSKLNPCP